MEKQPFDGAVTISCAPSDNMKTLIVHEALERAIPENKEWPLESSAAILFSSLGQFLGRTKTILLMTEDAQENEDVQDLIEFWTFASNTTDYRAIWNAFIMLRTAIHNEWYKVIKASDDARLKAPDIVQPGAPSDEQLEQQGEDGKKKSQNVIPTSKPLMTKQKRLQRESTNPAH